MSRKRCHRRVVVPLPPRGLRPKLTRDQLQDLGLAHMVNLDTLATGQADEATLWQWVGGCLPWSRVAEMLKVGQAEMTAQLELVTAVVERYGRTGRAVFTGPEYQLAKLGVGYIGQKWRNPPSACWLQQRAAGLWKWLRGPDLAPGDEFSLDDGMDTQSIQLQLNPVVDGRLWRLYQVFFDTAEGTFGTYIYALSTEHAAAILAELKDSARLGGEVLGSVAA